MGPNQPRTPTGSRRRSLFLGALLLFLIGAAFVGYLILRGTNCHLVRRSPWTGSPPSLSVSTDALADTVVVPTLDAPMPPGKNVIWCASFALAWERLQDDVVGGPLQVADAQEFADRLNAVGDIQQDLPEKVAYGAAGVASPELISRITRERSRRFPHAPDLELDVPDGHLLAYAYLAANVRFRRPFFDNEEPLTFRDTAGSETAVASFGLRPKDTGGFERLRQQVEVVWADHLHSFHEPGEPEYVLDLDRESKPTQLLLARVDARETLAATLDYIHGKEPSGEAPWLYPRAMDTNDTLLVPNVDFQLTHHFAELEGPAHHLLNPGFEDYWFYVARQDIAFRLDKSGADLRSEARMYLASGPSHYTFDRPFLVVMNKRDADRPFFVAWIENPELLVPKGGGR